MTALVEMLERGHDRFGRIIDQVFPPSHEGEEVAVWERHWSERLALAESTGKFPEHHTMGKRWLYERVADAVERCAGGSVDGKAVAEFGCGSGYATLCLANRGARPVLIDASESALRYSRRLARYFDCGQRASFVWANLVDDEPLGPFDITFNSGVLEHYPTDVAALMLRNMIRAARPGGAVVVILPNLIAPVLLSRMMRSRSKGSERFYTPWLLGRVFERAGAPKSRSGHVNAYLPVETPMWALRFFGPLLRGLAPGLFSALFFRWTAIPKDNAP